MSREVPGEFELRVLLATLRLEGRAGGSPAYSAFSTRTGSTSRACCSRVCAVATPDRLLPATTSQTRHRLGDNAATL